MPSEPVAGGRWQLGRQAVEHLGQRGGGPPELEHLAGEVVEADGGPGSTSGEDRFHGLVDRVVEDAEDGPSPSTAWLRATVSTAAGPALANSVSARRSWLTRSTARSSGSTVSTKRRCQRQLDLPELDGFLGGHPPGSS